MRTSLLRSISLREEGGMGGKRKEPGEWEKKRRRRSTHTHPARNNQKTETRGLTLAPAAPFSPGAGAGRPALPPSLFHRLDRPRSPTILPSAAAHPRAASSHHGRRRRPQGRPYPAPEGGKRPGGGGGGRAKPHLFAAPAPTR